jgi:hypothetical protein
MVSFRQRVHLVAASGGAWQGGDGRAAVVLDDGGLWQGRGRPDDGRSGRWMSVAGAGWSGGGRLAGGGKW